MVHSSRVRGMGLITDACMPACKHPLGHVSTVSAPHADSWVSNPCLPMERSQGSAQFEADALTSSSWVTCQEMASPSLSGSVASTRRPALRSAAASSFRRGRCARALLPAHLEVRLGQHRARLGGQVAHMAVARQHLHACMHAFMLCQDAPFLPGVLSKWAAGGVCCRDTSAMQVLLGENSNVTL